MTPGKRRTWPLPASWLASRDADRLNTELAGGAVLVISGFTVTAKDAAFDISDHDSYADPHGTNVLCSSPPLRG
ncbi:hypothetical protein OV450_3502 [Actinobacteria bacterium OV450]|nr:hypothetical protein OV450_3502 [Actinobacteria bacterium OV450]